MSLEQVGPGRGMNGSLTLLPLLPMGIRAWKVPSPTSVGLPQAQLIKFALHPPITFNCCTHVLQEGITAFPGDASDGEISTVKT